MTFHPNTNEKDDLCETQDLLRFLEAVGFHYEILNTITYLIGEIRIPFSSFYQAYQKSLHVLDVREQNMIPFIDGVRLLPYLS